MNRTLSKLLGAMIALSATSAMADFPLTLLPKCEEVIKAKVQKQVLDKDETASIAGIKLLYGGSHRGLHHNSVVIVRVSAEAEPEDYLVVTKVDSDDMANSIGCKIKYFKSIEYGLLPDIF